MEIVQDADQLGGIGRGDVPMLRYLAGRVGRVGLAFGRWSRQRFRGPLFASVPGKRVLGGEDQPVTKSLDLAAGCVQDHAAPPGVALL